MGKVLRQEFHFPIDFTMREHLTVKLPDGYWARKGNQAFKFINYFKEWFLPYWHKSNRTL
jgi:hypothetical protein